MGDHLPHPRVLRAVEAAKSEVLADVESTCFAVDSLMRRNTDFSWIMEEYNRLIEAVEKGLYLI
jgi:hypothetical protein